MDEGHLPMDFIQEHELLNLYQISIIWRQPLRLTLSLICIIMWKIVQCSMYVISYVL